jgi:hypothetical protein
VSLANRNSLLARRRTLHTNQTLILGQLRAMPYYDQGSKLALALKQQRDRNARDIAQIDSALRAIEQWRP